MRYCPLVEHFFLGPCKSSPDEIQPKTTLASLTGYKMDHLDFIRPTTPRKGSPIPYLHKIAVRSTLIRTIIRDGP